MSRVAASAFLSIFLMMSLQFQPGSCQPGVVDERSSTSSTITEVPVKGYAFKYKERFRNYSEQIDNAETKGWLTAEKASKYRDLLQQLRTQEASAGKSGYQKADIDALDKAVTKFNMDLTNSEQK